MGPDALKISVVLTTYNGVAFVEQQLQSIFKQTVLPDEVIVCDDGSTDGTLSILQQWETAGKITLIKNKVRLGVMANFKMGVSCANPSHFIALCDQDDIWLPYKLEKNIQSLPSATFPSLVYSDLIFMRQDQAIINPSFYNEMGLDKFKHDFGTALFGSLLLGCTIMMNPSMRSHFEKMPVNNHFYHDAWLGLLGFGIGNVHFIYEPLVQYRLHDKNASIAGFKPRNKWINAMRHILLAPFKSSYLKNELILAKIFKAIYFDQLSEQNQFLLTEFLSLENKFHFQKKWAFEKAFKDKWIQRF